MTYDMSFVVWDVWEDEEDYIKKVILNWTRKLFYITGR